MRVVCVCMCSSQNSSEYYVGLPLPGRGYVGKVMSSTWIGHVEHSSDQRSRRSTHLTCSEDHNDLTWTKESSWHFLLGPNPE